MSVLSMPGRKSTGEALEEGSYTRNLLSHRAIGTGRWQSVWLEGHEQLGWLQMGNNHRSGKGIVKTKDEEGYHTYWTDSGTFVYSRDW